MNDQSVLNVLNYFANHKVFSTTERRSMANSFRACHTSDDVYNLTRFYLLKFVSKLD